MKKLIFLELILLFLATTFQSDNPPGWYQQTLPVNDFINDIFFLDSQSGWLASGSTGISNDTGYIIKTTNGGDNWITKLKVIINFNAIQFISIDIGFAAGGDGNGKFLKTTNGGDNWSIINLGAATNQIQDLQFIDENTGWICSNNAFGGGVFKTINGGSNWLRLTDPGEFTKLFFLNADTGWVNANGTQKRLYRTTNGGMNWELQFISAFDIGSIFFLSGKKGWMRGGSDLTGNGVSFTTDGGYTWIKGQGEIGGFDIKFVNDSIGYAGGGNEPLRIIKSTNGGKYWGYQHALVTPDIAVSTLMNDTLLAWAGNQILNHTDDGGGTLVDIRNNETQIPLDFKLEQNFPNPFNPETIIKYKLQSPSIVKLKVFNIEGKEIKELVNKRQNAGEYNVGFDGSGLPSGVYYYRMEITNEVTFKTFYDSKKMILIR